MEYWLYLDDSGKFTNISDKHTLYGGILFDSKKRRDHFIKRFKEKRSKITNKVEIKSHEIVKLYKKSIKNINKRANIEGYLAELRHANAVFCVWTCKKELHQPAQDEEHAKLKRNEMIASLLQYLITIDKIKSNSSIKIYLDEIDTQTIREIDAKKLKEYLNKNYSLNGMVRFLRARQITIEKVVHLESSSHDCIQAADIIANLSNKHLNSYPETYKFFDLLKNHNIKILSCKFPNIVYNDDIQLNNCCRSESSR